MYLNTSHVKVKQFYIDEGISASSNLNTSHVKVKLFCKKLLTNKNTI